MRLSFAGDTIDNKKPAVTDEDSKHHQNQLIDWECGSSPPSENQRLSLRPGNASGLKTAAGYVKG